MITNPLCGTGGASNDGVLSRPCLTLYTDLGVHQMLCDLKRSEALSVRDQVSISDGVVMFSSTTLRYFRRNWWLLNLCHPEDSHQGWPLPLSEAGLTKRQLSAQVGTCVCVVLGMSQWDTWLELYQTLFQKVATAVEMEPSRPVPTGCSLLDSSVWSVLQGIFVWGIRWTLWPGSWCCGPTAHGAPEECLLQCGLRLHRVFPASLHRVLSLQLVLSCPHCCALSPGFPRKWATIAGKHIPFPVHKHPLKMASQALAPSGES